jgi:hypothetical protein
VNLAGAAAFVFERQLVVAVNASAPGVRQKAMNVERRSFMLMICSCDMCIWDIKMVVSMVEIEIHVGRSEQHVNEIEYSVSK